MNLEDQLEELMQDQHFDICSVGVFDLKTKKSRVFHQQPGFSPYFDLASLTKPLTLAFAYQLRPDLFSEQELHWLLSHRAGLPSGGRLSKHNWRQQILAYPITETSEDLYSDYSALRLMLELEKKMGKSLYSICSELWSKEILHWTDLSEEFFDNHFVPVTGIRGSRWIHGEVHDDNAFVIGEKLSHAGLFGTVEGVIESLLRLFDKTDALNVLNKELKKTLTQRRFILGFDRPQNLLETLAGTGCSSDTIGHLGFTGTSFWIDLQKQRGWVMLTNATQNFWYDKTGLNQMRREVGKTIWSDNFSV